MPSYRRWGSNGYVLRTNGGTPDDVDVLISECVRSDSSVYFWCHTCVHNPKRCSHIDLLRSLLAEHANQPGTE